MGGDASRMPTERCSIGKSEVGRAEAMARKGYDGVYIFKHGGREGLQLRVQRDTAAWIVRYKGYTVTIGYLHPHDRKPILSGHMKALDLASDTTGALVYLDGQHPKQVASEKIREYVLHRHAGLSHLDALAALRPNANTWTFKECVDCMLEERTAAGAEKPLKPSSVRELRMTFARQQVAHLMDRPASMLTRGEWEAARDAVRKASGISAAKKLVASVRSVYGYMARNHSGQSGVDGSDPWWKLFSAPYRIEARKRKPSLADIARTLLLAEEYLDKPLPGRMINAPGVGAGVLAGLWWLCLTCQRANAGMSLRAYDLVPDERREGWYLASWDPGVMKGGSAHLLPIPPRAARHIQRIRKKIKVKGANEWAFPSERDPDVHVSQSGVYRILRRLAAKDEVEAKRPEGWQPKKAFRVQRTERRDLLAEHGIEWWSLHDVRRTIQEVLDGAGIPGGTSVILAHDMRNDLDLTVSMNERQREDFLKNRVAKITQAAYGSAQFLSLKAQGMQIWTDALLDEYERQMALRSSPETKGAFRLLRGPSSPR